MTRKIIILTILATLALGCSYLKPVSMRHPPQNYINFAEDMAGFTTDWKREILRRYDDFYMIHGHGGTVNGRWCVRVSPGLYLDLEKYTGFLHDAMPDQRIVLIVCNPDGIRINTPNVTYATTNVWGVPDKFVPMWQNWKRDKPDNYIGNIYEFTEN